MNFNHHAKDGFSRQTKIIATLGPASNTYDTTLALSLAGANFFRLNFSHGTHDNHRTLYNNIHLVRQNNNFDIGVLGDLSGPKHRIGIFENKSIVFEPGSNFRFDLDPAPGDCTRVYLPCPEVMEALKPGQRILLDDGNVQMVVTEKGEDFVGTRIVFGEALSNNKGFNVPDIDIPLPALTEKDRYDMEFALNELGVDWIALSFVQCAKDIEEAKELINGRALLMAKIEKPQALLNLDDIMELSDGVMVARGDLGVECQGEDVPMIQQEIVKRSRLLGKPCVVATQMMESMIKNPTPTRAEWHDVSAAVAQGASAVMLSAETANGHYPVASVSVMDRACKKREFSIRRPEEFMHRIFGKVAHGNVLEMRPLIETLPAPAPLLTWEERRARGEQNLLTHLNEGQRAEKLAL